MVALGIGVDGRKAVLGLRELATENTSVVSALCEDLAARGWTSACRGCTCWIAARHCTRRCAGSVLI